MVHGLFRIHTHSKYITETHLISSKEEKVTEILNFKIKNKDKSFFFGGEFMYINRYVLLTNHRHWANI